MEWNRELESTLFLLTLEGEVIAIDVVTGQEVTISEIHPCQLWYGADVTGAMEVNGGLAHMLRSMGAHNVPPSNFDPSQGVEALFELQRPSATSEEHNDPGLS